MGLVAADEPNSARDCAEGLSNHSRAKEFFLTDAPPCGHIHISIDDQEVFSQRRNNPRLYNVALSERFLIWSNKKFSSGKAIVYNYSDADAKAILDGLITDYGPPTLKNDTLHLRKWTWPEDNIFINYYFDPVPKRVLRSTGPAETTLTIWYGRVE